jgi:soluble lytic murein transglycosylase-like protein
MNPNQAELIAVARSVAEKHGMDAALLCAIIEQESNWDPWALRHEVGYTWLYDIAARKPWRAGLRIPAPAGVSSDTEYFGQKTSWGLLQVMGAVARERGFAGKFFSELCSPAVGLEIGCKHLAYCLRVKGHDVSAALKRWNGGEHYAGEVLARVGKYKP